MRASLIRQHRSTRPRRKQRSEPELHTIFPVLRSKKTGPLAVDAVGRPRFLRYRLPIISFLTRIVQSFFPIPTLFFLLALTSGGLSGCNSERVISAPPLPREQEISRFRAGRTNAPPVIFGLVQVVDNTGRYPLPKAQVLVDGKPFYSNEAGAYRLQVKPGSHQFIVEKTGMRPARTTVKTEPGDSVQVNFFLRLDSRD